MNLSLLPHYALTLYRSLTRHRLYAVLNVLGLAVGIAVFLVLMLDVRFETSFDTWIPHASDTYRLDETIAFPGIAPRPSAKTSAIIAPLMKADYPQIAAYTHMVWDNGIVRRGAVFEREDVRYVDPDFFDVLALPLARGEARTALAAPEDVVVTETIARKYFGTTDVVGRTLALTEDGQTAPTTVRVSAVLRDLPRNTHLTLAVLKALNPTIQKRFESFANWNAQEGSTYLRFRGRADARAVQADLAHFVERRAKGDDQTKLGADPGRRLALRLTPLAAIHFDKAITSADFQPNVDAGVVASLAVVGALTLGIAILNYINLATAQAALRAREVALRKTLGATRPALIGQFLAESLAIAALAVVLGVALTELALPVVNALGGGALRVDYAGADGVLPALMALALAVGLGAGIYPALILSGYAPARVLASSRMAGGGRLASRVRDVLVIAQFAAAVGFGICTFVLYAQSKFIERADRGFRHDGLILVESLQADDLMGRQPMILDTFRQIPGVQAVTASNREPNPQSFGAVPIHVPGQKGSAPTLMIEVVGPDYFRTYGIDLIGGRRLDTAHGQDDTFRPPGGQAPKRLQANVVINRAAVRSLGFTSPSQALGARFQAGDGGGGLDATVVGVARDVRFTSPHEPVQPLFYIFNSQAFNGAIAAVRFGGADTGEMLARLRATWRRLAPGDPFVAAAADLRLSAYYVADQQRSRLFMIGALLAVGIACFGLYGLAAFTTTRRVKEIGIRKALGAGTADVLRLLVGQFLRPVLIANLIAWPLAWFAMRGWLAGFDQRIALSPLYFLAATAITLVIAVATVAGQAWSVARAEPARALRHE